MGLVIGLCLATLLQLNIDLRPRFIRSSWIWLTISSRCLSFYSISLPCISLRTSCSFSWPYLKACCSWAFLLPQFCFSCYFLVTCLSRVFLMFSSSICLFIMCASLFLQNPCPPSQFLRVWSRALVSFSRSQFIQSTSLQFRFGMFMADTEFLKGSRSLMRVQMSWCSLDTRMSQAFFVSSNCFFLSCRCTDFWSSSQQSDWQAFWQFRLGVRLISISFIMFWSSWLRRF